MSYVALYRKYRPLTFTDMVGQEHVTNVLKNQIKSNKISHAYIFSGTRGTGKTSAAKVFARAVNCLNPKNGDPCNECEACKSILLGETTDVVEMDAASNNSVDNIREIRQEVAYATTSLKYKIYIIDEAHMLSTSAFNALLKTLEEPPSNVIFILATTEEHKILPTILSRCIRFEFRKISRENIINRLEYILKDSGIEYEKEAIEYIAKISDGGMRDAISILERCIIDSNEKITCEKLRILIGNVEEDVIDDLLKEIIRYNQGKTVENVDKILSMGKNIRYITGELAEKFMSILLEKKEKEYGISEVRLNQIIKELFKMDSDIRQSVNAELLFKAKMLELSSNINFANEQELLEKIKELEIRIEKMENSGIGIIRSSAIVQKKEPEINVKDSPKPKEEQKTISKCIVEKTEMEEEKKAIKTVPKGVLFKEMDKLKNILVEKDNLQLYSALSGVKANVIDNSIVFETENTFAFTIMNKEENRDMLKQVVRDISNDEYSIVINKFEKSNNAKNSFEEHMLNNNMPFTVVD